LILQSIHAYSHKHKRRAVKRLQTLGFLPTTQELLRYTYTSFDYLCHIHFMRQTQFCPFPLQYQRPQLSSNKFASLNWTLCPTWLDIAILYSDLHPVFKPQYHYLALVLASDSTVTLMKLNSAFQFKKYKLSYIRYAIGKF
jgi:hypothetical protein